MNSTPFKVTKDQQGRQTLTDLNTGERLQDALLAVTYPKKARIDRKFMMLWLEGADLLASMNLTGKECTAFWKLLAYTSWENWIEVTPAQLARDLGMKPQNTYRVIKSLLVKGVILRVTTPGGIVKMRLNPEIAWKGEAANFMAYQRAKNGLTKKPLRSRRRSV